MLHNNGKLIPPALIIISIIMLYFTSASQSALQNAKQDFNAAALLNTNEDNAYQYAELDCKSDECSTSIVSDEFNSFVSNIMNRTSLDKVAEKSRLYSIYDKCKQTSASSDNTCYSDYLNSIKIIDNK